LAAEVPAGESSEKFVKIVAGEPPLERLGYRAVVVLKEQNSLLQLLERGEVVGCQSLSLQDGEVDFDLIKPAGVDGCLDNHEVGPLSLESALARLSAMGRAVVDDPEYPPSRAVRGLTHDLVDKAIERGNAGRGLTTAMDLGTPHIPGRQVGPSAQPFVFVLDTRMSLRGCGPRVEWQRCRA